MGWPDALSDTIQLSNGLLLARPSPRDLRELFDAEVSNRGSDAAVANYSTRIIKLRDRLRERRRLQSDLSMPQTQDWLKLDEEIEAIDLLIAGQTS